MWAPSVMEHQAIFQAMHLVSQQTLVSKSGITCFSRLQLLAHIVRRMAFNLADHAARIQLGAACKYTNTTPFPGANQERGHTTFGKMRRNRCSGGRNSPLYI